ncbi:fibronectin-binding protein A N-terminus-domain-containing protein [Coemansia spiralis]|uniref:DUF814-domain-containing protein n=1 Tax=Coemansia umbellata TaxID=1424467 RepID=A0ABQ8PD31_9FUNG|nr:fibronectin-binding protein A N-terminus-domain-containing protein [Coemansia spiralis]KAI9501132.1 fibronectin-binding protein A N-terminus-domain-containing protein [Coemansia spiralis]KAJ1986340.1 hypothetical protein EDC05_006327 [Coemansia umbellata]
MKQRFSSLDVRAIVTALQQRIVGLRLQGIYDVNSKTFLFKFTKPDHKELVLVESGIRLHTTDYIRDKSITPSSFCMKLRKHLKARRLTAVRQFGLDRVVDFEFGVAAGPHNEGTYHVLCEFYASGNIILTNYQYQILALLRVVHLENEPGYAVGKTYSLSSAREIELVSKDELIDWLKKAGPKDNLKRHLATFGAYGPALSEHVILRAKLNASLRVATSLDLDPQSPQIISLVDAYSEAYNIVQKLKTTVYPGYITFLPQKDDAVGGEELFDDFGPWLFEQFRSKTYKEYASFADAADVFFSNIEAQKLKTKAYNQEHAAERKLEAIKNEHKGRVEALELAHRKTEEQARRIEMNLEFVDQAIMIIRQAVAAGMDWKELEDLISDQKDQGNPVAERILKLNLSINQITLELDDPDDWDESDSSDAEDEDGAKGFSGPMAVDVDIFETAFANAQRYYNSRRQAGIKHAKTVAISSQALQSAEKKIKADLKANKITSTVSQQRKAFWFEKFSWFVSSDGYLVLAGHDMQQNELLVKRHLRPGDAYVHADMHGAASVIVKNKYAAAPEAASAMDKAAVGEGKRKSESTAEAIPPSTLFQAGIMSVCQSRAWDAKIVTSAWWVEAHQVSKTAPTGEYLSTGSFMIRGKKRFLPPTQLVYGFGFSFRLADDESIARHISARQQRLAIMEENRKAVEAQVSPHVEEPNDLLAHGDSKPNDASADLDEFTVVGAGTAEPEKKKSGKQNKDELMNFAAARIKYNLDEIDMAVEDSFDAETNLDTAQQEGDGRRHLTAKERRDIRKQKNKADSSGSFNKPSGKLSKKEQRRLEDEEMFEKEQQMKQKQHPQKRGKKGKMKKIKEKYAEQDEEDRELRMALLGARGRQDVDEVLKSARASGDLQADTEHAANNADSEPAPATAQHPPNIINQLHALTTNDLEPLSSNIGDNAIEAKEPADDAEDVADISIDQLGVLDTLTSTPLPGDNLSFAIPVCAPYSALSSYKYRVKLVPGTMKKGRACKMALTVVLTAADGNKPKSVHSSSTDEAEQLELEVVLANREKELMKAVPEPEMIAQMLGKVKVTAPNMESIKQKSKAVAKSKAKAKSNKQDDN